MLFVNACRWGYDNFQVKQEVLMLKLHSRFVRVKLLPLLFSKVSRNFTLQLRHWMKSYKPRKKWTWLHRMLIVWCYWCLGNHWKYPLSSHHHQAGVQSQHLRTLSQWLPGDARSCQGHQPTWEGGNRGNWKLAGSITHHPRRLALPSGSSKKPVMSESSLAPNWAAFDKMWQQPIWREGSCCLCSKKPVKTMQDNSSVRIFFFKICGWSVGKQNAWFWVNCLRKKHEWTWDKTQILIMHKPLRLLMNQTQSHRPKTCMYAPYRPFRPFACIKVVKFNLDHQKLGFFMFVQQPSKVALLWCGRRTLFFHICSTWWLSHPKKMCFHVYWYISKYHRSIQLHIRPWRLQP